MSYTLADHIREYGRVPVEFPCTVCFGTGRVNVPGVTYANCALCGGTGLITHHFPVGMLTGDGPTPPHLDVLVPNDGQAYGERMGLVPHIEL